MMQESFNRQAEPSTRARKIPKDAVEAVHVVPLGHVVPHNCHACGRGQSVKVIHRRHAYCEVQGRECGHKWLYFFADAHQKAHTAPCRVG